VTAAGYAFSPRGAVRMWQRNATVGRKTMVTTLTPRFVEAIAYLAIMGLGLGTYLTTVDGVDYVDFIAPGVAASTVMFGAVIETTYNSFVRIHVRRVVEAVVTTPLSLADVVVGEYLWAATRAVFAVLGMAYTALVSNIEHYNIFYTGVLTPMFLFGGVFFPFSDLPGWAQVIGWCLPLSHLVAATRELTLGDAGLVTLAHVAALVALLLVVFPFPAARLRRTLLR
jgi:lipooligosaccharide transport system permease protein